MLIYIILYILFVQFVNLCNLEIHVNQYFHSCFVIKNSKPVYKALKVPQRVNFILMFSIIVFQFSSLFLVFPFSLFLPFCILILIDKLMKVGQTSGILLSVRGRGRERKGTRRFQ